MLNQKTQEEKMLKQEKRIKFVRVEGFIVGEDGTIIEKKVFKLSFCATICERRV